MELEILKTIFHFYILPGENAKKTTRSKSSDTTNASTENTTSFTESVAVTSTAEIQQTTTTGPSSGTGTLPKTTGLRRHNSQVSLQEDSEDQESKEDEERVPVGWLYDLKKEELIEEMSKHNLNTAGKAADLRKRFSNFLQRQNRQSRYPKQAEAAYEYGSTMTPSGLSKYKPDPSVVSPLMDESRGVREILGLSPNADVNTVKRFLTSLVETTKSKTSFPSAPHRSGDHMFQFPSLSTGTNVTFATKENLCSYNFNPPPQVRTDREIRNSDHLPTVDLESTPNNAATICNIARKWNLTYDGDRNPVAFLERLGELMDCYGILPDDVVKALPEILKGKALLWYRNNRELWGNFADFQEAFEMQYLPPGYNRNLEDEIRLRTQGEDEPFRNFVVAITTLIRRRGGYTMADKLDRIYCNMKPDYKLSIRREKCSTIQDMIQEAEYYESYVREKSLYRPPPNPSQALVPETAYYPKNRLSRYYNRVETVNVTPNVPHFTAISRREDCANTKKPELRNSLTNTRPERRDKVHHAGVVMDGVYRKKEEISGRSHDSLMGNWVQRRTSEDRQPNATNKQPRQQQRPGDEPIVCWNCDTEGHKSPDCTKPKVIKCFYCKKTGVRTVHCPCRQGNEPRVSDRGGHLRSRTMETNPHRPPTNGTTVPSRTNH